MCVITDHGVNVARLATVESTDNDDVTETGEKYAPGNEWEAAVLHSEHK
jgi:antitoxin (DNA-binding transcriptional repressor) of toxin-antitoxin stability system